MRSLCAMKQVLIQEFKRSVPKFPHAEAIRKQKKSRTE